MVRIVNFSHFGLMLSVLPFAFQPHISVEGQPNLETSEKDTPPREPFYLSVRTEGFSSDASSAYTAMSSIDTEIKNILESLNYQVITDEHSGSNSISIVLINHSRGHTSGSVIYAPTGHASEVTASVNVWRRIECRLITGHRVRNYELMPLFLERTVLQISGKGLRGQSASPLSPDWYAQLLDKKRIRSIAFSFIVNLDGGKRASYALRTTDDAKVSVRIMQSLGHRLQKVLTLLVMNSTVEPSRVGSILFACPNTASAKLVLSSAARSRRVEDRIRAVQVFKEIINPRAGAHKFACCKPFARRLLKDSSPDVRREAVSFIYQIADKKSLRHLKKAMESETDEEVRELLQEACAKLGV
jgi:hypothetical protein